jgi:hypothetical protein
MTTKALQVTRAHKGAYSHATFQGESAIQARIIAYLKAQYPHIPYYGNATANIYTGANMGPQRPGESHESYKARKALAGGAIHKMKKSVDLGAQDGWPDLQICAPSNLIEGETLHGLFLELKDIGRSPFYVNKPGIKADERAHLQALTLSQLCAQGYMAMFAVGEQDAKLIIDAYLGNANARKIMASMLDTMDIGNDRWIYRLK